MKNKMYVSLNKYAVVRSFGKYGVIFDTRDYREKIIIVTRSILLMLKLLYEGNTVEDSIRKISSLFNLRASHLYKALKTLELKGIVRLNDKYVGEPINRVDMFKDPNDELPHPLYMILNPTFKCNLKCKFCFYKPYINNAEDVSNIGDYLKILTEGIKIGIPFIDIIGGEPLLYNDIVKLLKFIVKNPFNCAITVNGTVNPSRELIELFRRATRKGNDHALLNLSVSLHAASEEIHDKLVGVRGAYRRVMKFIKLLDEQDILYSINTIVMNENINELKYLAEKLIKLRNITQWNLLYYTKMSYTEPEELPLNKFFNVVQRIINKYSSKIRIQILAPFVWVFDKNFNDSRSQLYKYKLHDYIFHFLVNFYSRCSLPYRIEVFPDGTFVPCGLLAIFPPWSKRKKYNSLIEAWNSKEFKIARKRARLKICVKCGFKDICKGQCLAYVLDKGLSYNDPDPRCPLIDNSKV